MVTDLSAGPPVNQRSATLAYSTSKEDDAVPTFENFDVELEFLQREEARFEK